jgi:hypothetical protein
VFCDVAAAATSFARNRTIPGHDPVGKMCQELVRGAAAFVEVGDRAAREFRVRKKLDGIGLDNSEVRCPLLRQISC